MRRATTVLWGMLAALALLGMQAVSMAAEHASTSQKAPQQNLSPKVGKALRTAQEAMQKQDWNAAYEAIREAQAVTDKKPYDDYQIAEMLGYVEIKREHYAEAAEAFGQSVDSGFLASQDLTDRLALLAQLQSQLKNFPKAIDFAKRALANGGNTQINLDALIGQDQYLSGNFREAADAMAQAVMKAHKAGKPVQETWLEVELSAYGQLKDEAGVIGALQQLAIEFPQPKYLDELFVHWKRAKSDDRALLHLYRLMFELGRLEHGEDYVGMAQLSTDLGLPGEAVNVIQQAKAKKAFTDDVEGEQARRALEAAKAKSVGDMKAIQELEASTPKSGEDQVQLGIARASYGEYAKAVDLLKAGIAAGGLKRPDEAQIVLGQTLLKLGRRDEAQTAFRAVSETAKLGVIAQLWQAYTGPQAAQAPAKTS